MEDVLDTRNWGYLAALKNMEHVICSRFFNEDVTVIGNSNGILSIRIGKKEVSGIVYRESVLDVLTKMLDNSGSLFLMHSREAYSELYEETEKLMDDTMYKTLDEFIVGYVVTTFRTNVELAKEQPDNGDMILDIRIIED